MARETEYLAGARADFDASFDWYADRSSNVAIGFAAAVDEAIQKIVADPLRFPSTFGGCRYCSLRRYPFRLVFRDESDRVVVVAIAMRSGGLATGTVVHERERSKSTKTQSAGRRWGLKANGTPTGRPTKALYRGESA